MSIFPCELSPYQPGFVSDFLSINSESDACFGISLFVDYITSSGGGRVSRFANVCLKIDFMSVDICFSRELAARTGPEVVDIPRMSH